MTQADLGAILGITKSAYSQLESGKNKFSVEQLSKVATHLGLELQDLSNSLPMQAKTAPVSAQEYLKVVNQLVELQQNLSSAEEALGYANDEYTERYILELENPPLRALVDFYKTASSAEKRIMNVALEAALRGHIGDEKMQIALTSEPPRLRRRKTGR